MILLANCSEYCDRGTSKMEIVPTERTTHFVGASCSSMSPFMKVAMLPAALLVWSAVFDRLRALSSSSSTLTDFWFSDFVLAVLLGTESMTSTDGIV